MKLFIFESSTFAEFISENWFVLLGVAVLIILGVIAAKM